jgi:hypothetical protein
MPERRNAERLVIELVDASIERGSLRVSGG